MTREEILIYCLNDAYAMEEGSVRLLRSIHSQPGNTPELDAKLGTFIQECETNTKDLRRCIESLGGKVSTTDGMSPLLVEGVMPAVKAGLPDQQVKNGALLHGLMHYGHATGMALIRGAEVLGEPAVLELAQKLSGQKEAGALWLEKRIPDIWDAFREQQLEGSETAAPARSTSRPAVSFGERLGDMTKAELEDKAKELNIPYSNKTKDELIDEIERQQG
jgi:ferritin-like metal-binding protein YciE